MKPSFLLADDDISIRQMLAFVIKQMHEFKVVGEAGDGEEALRQCQELRPNVVVADLRMPKMDGVALLREIRRRRLRMAVLFYTAALDDAAVLAAIDAEPEGLVLKCDELATLRNAFQVVATGGAFWGPRATELREQRRCAAQRFALLTAAEREVLKLLARGNSTKEIAAYLKKGTETVKHQRQSIMNKIGVHQAVALAAIAREAGLG